MKVRILCVFGNSGTGAVKMSCESTDRSASFPLLKLPLSFSANSANAATFVYATTACSRVIASVGLEGWIEENIMFRYGFIGPSEPSAKLHSAVNERARLHEIHLGRISAVEHFDKRQMTGILHNDHAQFSSAFDQIPTNSVTVFDSDSLLLPINFDLFHCIKNGLDALISGTMKEDLLIEIQRFLEHFRNLCFRKIHFTFGTRHIHVGPTCRCTAFERSAVQDPFDAACLNFCTLEN